MASVVERVVDVGVFVRALDLHGPDLPPRLERLLLDADLPRALLFGAGLTAGLSFWGLVAATGLGTLLERSAHGLAALKILGGLYLLWLAFQSGRTALRGGHDVGPARREGAWFRRGVVLNLSNPKAVVAWMAALSMGMSADYDIATRFGATHVRVGSALFGPRDSSA